MNKAKRKQPPSLKQGDTVALAAPARKVNKAEVEASVRLFEAWGLRVKKPAHLFDEDNQWAGDDRTRAALMQDLLDDPEVKAIVCARGGYGTVRIIDRLDFGKFAEKPKWIVGYSDVTVLHSHIGQTLGIETLHATMPINIPDNATTRAYPSTETLRKALFGERLTHICRNHLLNREGEAEGVLVGGNLSILYSLCGTRSSIDTRGKILFIEDLDEYLYHIDRMMMNLKRNGMLEGLAGLVVGQMSDMHDNAIPFGCTAKEIVMESVEEYGYPVAFDFPAGHNGTDNHALILGRRCKLKVGGMTELAFGPERGEGRNFFEPICAELEK